VIQTKIRKAAPGDADELLAIYRPLVENTTISFELTPPSPEAFAKRIESAIKTHEWLVMEASTGICGYAYATPHRPRVAYKFSAETSVYVHADYYRQGVGKHLYKALHASLRSRGFHNAYAGIALPNAASIALHQATGFEAVGIFREVGFKFDEWHDVSWWQRKT
jgi:phosphinothricin acetyltransferase